MMKAWYRLLTVLNEELMASLLIIWEGIWLQRDPIAAS